MRLFSCLDSTRTPYRGLPAARESQIGLAGGRILRVSVPLDRSKLPRRWA